jgi:hypothetical protein
LSYGRTNGDVLRDAVVFALRKVKLHIGRRFVRVEVTDQQRYEIGDHVVHELKRRGDPWRLSEPVPDNQPGPRWEDGKPPPEAS